MSSFSQWIEKGGMAGGSKSLQLEVWGKVHRIKSSKNIDMGWDL